MVLEEAHLWSHDSRIVVGGLKDGNNQRLMEITLETLNFSRKSRGIFLVNTVLTKIQFVEQTYLSWVCYIVLLVTSAFLIICFHIKVSCDLYL